MADIFYHVGGGYTLYEGNNKNFWKIKDDGSSLTVVDSLLVAGNHTIQCMALGLDGSIYIGPAMAVSPRVYKYNSDLTLDISWGDGGYYDIPKLAHGLSVDAEGRLAITYNYSVGDTNNVILLDADGSLLWQVQVGPNGFHGRSIRFLDTDYILVGLRSDLQNQKIAKRIKISDGSEVNTYASISPDSSVTGLDHDLTNSKVYFAINDHDVGNKGFARKYPMNGTEEPAYAWTTTDIAVGGIWDILLHSNGYVYTIGYPATGIDTNIFKLNDSDGTVLDSYEAGSQGYVVVEDDNGNVVVGGNAAMDFGGIPYDIAVMDTDLTFLRGIQLDSQIRTLIGKNEVPGEVPVITDQSTDMEVNSGAETTLFVTATGDPAPTYQWKYGNDVVIPGETGDTLTIYPIVDGTYKCVATNVMGSDTSDDIVVTVVSNPYRYDIFDLQLDIDRS